MLRAHRRIVHSGGNRVGRHHLSILILQQIRVAAVQYSRLAAIKAGSVLSEFIAFAASFDADECDCRIINERRKNANRVRSAADTRNHEIGISADFRTDLSHRFVADHRLKKSDHFWIGMGAERRP